MCELYFDKRGEVGMEECEKLFRMFPKFADRAVSSAFKSEGNRMRAIIKLAIQRGGPNGEWEKLNPHTPFMRKMHGQRWGNQWVKNWRSVWAGEKGHKKRVRQYRLVSAMGVPSFRALQKMAGAVRYKYDPSDMLMSIGFLNDNRKMQEWAKHHAGGARIAITPRMRRLAFAMGMPLAKDTSEIKVPARPLVNPIFKKEEKNIRQNLQNKIYANVRRYVTGAEKT
jgi:hypothetical protein